MNKAQTRLMIMIQCSHRKLVGLQGVVWLLIGCTLMQLGLNYLIQSASFSHYQTGTLLLPLLERPLGGEEQAAVAVIALALFIGYFQGRYTLGRSISRTVMRILRLPNPSSICKLYERNDLLFLGAVTGLGLLLHFSHLPRDLLGAVDVTLGSALVNGSLMYFRYAIQLNSNPPLPPP